MKESSNLFHTNGFFLHTAAVLRSEGVMLFLGHSGSGKSTLSKLLSDRYEILRDDRAFVQMQKNGMWFVKDDFNSTTCYPLHSIIRIFGAHQPELIPLPPIKTCEYLMDAVFEIDHQRRSRDIEFEKQCFTKTAQIARYYPGWLLQFSLQKSDILNQLQKMN